MRSIFAHIQSDVERTWSAQTSCSYGQASSLPIPTITITPVPAITDEVWLLEFAPPEKRCQDLCHLQVPKRELHRPMEEIEETEKADGKPYVEVKDSEPEWYGDINAACKSMLDNILNSAPIDEPRAPKTPKPAWYERACHRIKSSKVADRLNQDSQGVNHKEENFTSAIPGRRQKFLTAGRRAVRRCTHVTKVLAGRGRYQISRFIRI